MSNLNLTVAKGKTEQEYDACIYFCLNSLLKYHPANEEEFHKIFKPVILSTTTTPL